MFRPKKVLSQNARETTTQSDEADKMVCEERRSFLLTTAWLIGAGIAPGFMFRALDQAGAAGMPDASPLPEACALEGGAFPTKSKVPNPKQISFRVQYPGKDPIELKGHFWYNRETLEAGRKCPAIVELNPYRRRDGMMSGDSAWYPWFAYHDYLCFRVDLQGSGDSQGILTDEYTDEELVYCTQVINQIANHSDCDGNVGMMGESWSAINSLMVAARADCPSALKAVLVICGTDDRYNDDVHYMDGAMMQDNFAWPSSMWGWLSLPPDPLVVHGEWKIMWRERIRNADFWFRHWGKHQARDRYWSATSVRNRYDRVKVPVYIVSGYQDGYKNPVPRVVSGLHARGMPVQGLLGPWGHSQPNSGDPGPKIDWLPYVLTHWWDKWLKGTTPDPDAELPEMTVWLGESKEPSKSSCKREDGKWAAEDGDWAARVKEEVLYLRPDRCLSSSPPQKGGKCVGSNRLVLALKMLETSSWGRCGTDDLPGDQSEADSQSLYFDSAPLPNDLDCFGHPTVRLRLSCDKPVASIAVRLCEVSPVTNASHLVSYRFFNLCYRGGDMANPQPVEPGVAFDVSIPLNIVGHTFKQGWRVRLSISPSFFPTMWQAPEYSTITLYTGPAAGDSPMSTLSLPGRKPRPEDERLKALLPFDPEIVWVDAEQYLPTTTARKGTEAREAKSISILGKKGVVVRKVTDSGRYCYGGPLHDLWVEEVDRENFMILHDDPLSLVGFASSRATLERTGNGVLWKVMTRRTATVWTEKGQEGQYFFRYKATIRTFIGNADGGYEPFEQKTVKGLIPRLWV
jgi:uncharacterized protein